MIFVTVGTHEQQFDRLVRAVDNLKGSGVIQDEVVIQTGFSLYEPKNCTWSRWFPYEKMPVMIDKADIVITHGGPSSFLAVVKTGRVPIVFPRRKEYGEHVNDHQVSFARKVEERFKNIIVVTEAEELGPVIERYDSLTKDMTPGMVSNNRKFIAKFEKMIDGLFS